MFDQQFLDQLAHRIADILEARLSKPLPEVRYLSVPQAASYMDMTIPTVRFLIREGRLPVSRNGKLIRIDKKEIDAQMQKTRSSSK